MYPGCSEYKRELPRESNAFKGGLHICSGVQDVCGTCVMRCRYRRIRTARKFFFKTKIVVMRVRIDKLHQWISAPLGVSGSRNITRTVPSLSEDARTIPQLSTPQRTAGLRFATRTTFFPISSSGL